MVQGRCFPHFTRLDRKLAQPSIQRAGAMRREPRRRSRVLLPTRPRPLQWVSCDLEFVHVAQKRVSIKVQELSALQRIEPPKGVRVVGQSLLLGNLVQEDSNKPRPISKWRRASTPAQRASDQHAWPAPRWTPPARAATSAPPCPWPWTGLSRLRPSGPVRRLGADWIEASLREERGGE